MVRSSLRMALMREDLPAFGFPTTAILRPSFRSSRSVSSCSRASSFESSSSIVSVRMSIPRPCSADVGIPDPNPSLAKSLDVLSWSALSALFITRMTLGLDLRRSCATSSSMGLMPARASTTKTMRSDESIAIRASKVTAFENPSSLTAQMPPVSTSSQGVSVAWHGAAIRSRVTPG